MKQIILNADDFVRHAQINNAVERGVRDGVLRSATIMPGGAAFDDAAALAARPPALADGIHLTLVNGNPVLPPAEIPSLVTEAGVFVDDHAAFSLRVLRGAVNLAEVRAELAAQLRRVEAAGIRPTHADSHQHTHVLPGVLGIVLDLCCAAGIPAMRAPRARLFAGKFGGIGQLIGRTGLAILARRAAAKARQRGIRTPERGRSKSQRGDDGGHAPPRYGQCRARARLPLGSRLRGGTCCRLRAGGRCGTCGKRRTDRKFPRILTKRERIA